MRVNPEAVGSPAFGGSAGVLVGPLPLPSSPFTPSPSSSSGASGSQPWAAPSQPCGCKHLASPSLEPLLLPFRSPGQKPAAPAVFLLGWWSLSTQLPPLTVRTRVPPQALTTPISLAPAPWGSRTPTVWFSLDACPRQPSPSQGPPSSAPAQAGGGGGGSGQRGERPMEHSCLLRKTGSHSFSAQLWLWPHGWSFSPASLTASACAPSHPTANQQRLPGTQKLRQPQPPSAPGGGGLGEGARPGLKHRL